MSPVYHVDFEVIRTYVNQFRSPQVAAEQGQAAEADKDPGYRFKLQLLSRQNAQKTCLNQFSASQYGNEFARLKLQYDLS